MTRWIGVAASIIIALALGVLLFLGPTAGGVDNLRQVFASYGAWSVAISAGLTVSQAILAPLPGNVITITNGLVFGPVWGGILSWASTLLGASICFFLSKALGKPFALKIVGSSLEKAEGFFKTYGLQAVFIVRILPFVPFDAISYGAGMVGVPFSRFILATGVGIIPSIIVYSYIGTVIAGIYWWVLITLLSISLISIAIAAKVLSRVRPVTAQPSVAMSKTVA
jgi:uncharacterized membrane protein YdjX (TVP38/TMEM64 family)